MKVTLENCENLGSKAIETQGEKYLDWIAHLYEYAQEVGKGLTDLGRLMHAKAGWSHDKFTRLRAGDGPST